MKRMRRLRENQLVYVVDSWKTDKGPVAMEMAALILEIDGKKVDVLLYGSNYRIYSIDDYGKLIFDNEKEASEVAEKLPAPQEEIWVVDKDYISKDITEGIFHTYNSGVIQLYIRTRKHGDINISELGKKVFLQEEEAKETVKTKK